MPNDTDTMPEGSTMTPSQVRKLKIAIAIMSVLLVAGFILLLVGIYLQTQKLDHKSKNNRDLPVSASIDKPVNMNLVHEPGAELKQISASGDHLILYFHHPSGNEIVIVSLASGKETGRIRLTGKDSP